MTELVGRISYAAEQVPIHWWLPQRERAVLAVASALFWGTSTLQALQKDPHGASIYAFYGLGLLFIACSLANILSGLRRAMRQYRSDKTDEEQPRSLVQLLAILCGMLICNAIVLLIYVARGAGITPFDIVSMGLAVMVAIILLGIYGKQGIFTNAYSRGFLAMALKGLPQLMLAYTFIVYPTRASAFTLWALLSLTLMGLLRFWPSLLAYQRDPESRPLRGLMLGESGNIASIVCMFGAWTLAHIALGG